MQVKKEFIGNFLEYLKRIEAIHDKNRAKNVNSTILFRGQRESTWSLEPKIWRDYHHAKITADFLEYEADILSEFERRASIFQSNLPKDEWDKLATAQHYGLPTRLLDWTENPLIALWFAFQENQKSTGNRSVWAIEIENTSFSNRAKSPFKQGATKVFRPDQVSQRIVNQSGWFTVHHYSKSGKFYKFETISAFKASILRLDIPEKEREVIVEKLNFLGINKSSVFPDMEGLAGFLRMKYFKV